MLRDKLRLAGGIKPAEITPESVYRDRRQLLQGAAAAGLLAGVGPWTTAQAAVNVDRAKPGRFRSSEEQTSWADATSYNNFYEFGTGKDDPKQHAASLITDPWHVEIGGLVDKPGKIGLEELIRPAALRERIYRFRCVEAWSMVIPWVGVELREILQRFQPKSEAKYVAFQTLHDPKQMPGQRLPTLDWPYVEGLRLDEAMHPLTILAVGMYGKVLPNQNGAPVRLVVPWKYGFKSIKSIVKIDLVSKQPPTSWNRQAPAEYGFYANVNPNVDHPRWSQAKERRIGNWFKQETLMFNGYGTYVADLYKGMDLKKHY